ncbi:MAG: hypothetical protein KDA52_05005, partial [Planctomycetaceae bacterium]|nr:hypothetical protein [Planctomycetaceae bacterium]
MANLYRRGGRGRWYDQYFDHTGRRKTISARTSERATAQRIADRLEAEAALRRERVIDPREEAIAAQLAKPISDHLFDYRAKMKTAGRGSQHVDETLTILQNLTIACEFARV